MRDPLAGQENLDYVFEKLAQEVAAASTTTPETIRLKEAEFDAEQRRVGSFVEFVAEGLGSRALVDALTASERGWRTSALTSMRSAGVGTRCFQLRRRSFSLARCFVVPNRRPHVMPARSIHRLAEHDKYPTYRSEIAGPVTCQVWQILIEPRPCETAR